MAKLRRYYAVDLFRGYPHALAAQTIEEAVVEGPKALDAPANPAILAMVAAFGGEMPSPNPHPVDLAEWCKVNHSVPAAQIGDHRWVVETTAKILRAARFEVEVSGGELYGCVETFEVPAGVEVEEIEDERHVDHFGETRRYVATANFPFVAVVTRDYHDTHTAREVTTREVVGEII